MQPNKTNIRKWVKALRSKKYKQGRLNLHNKDNTFCCLGVACELSVPGWWKLTPDEVEVSSWIHAQNQYLPTPVMKWLGLDSANPMVSEKMANMVSEKSLTELNDDLEYSFDEIADLIEKEWLTQKEELHV
jgi:hypothetical protein